MKAIKKKIIAIKNGLPIVYVNQVVLKDFP